MNIQQQFNSALLAAGGIKKLNRMADLEEHKARGEEFLPHPETGERQWTTRADYANTISDTLEKQLEGADLSRDDGVEAIDHYIKGIQANTGMGEAEINNILDYTGASQRMMQRSYENYMARIEAKYGKIQNTEKRKELIKRGDK